MGLGVLEAREDVVPGTVVLYDRDASQQDTSHLKHTPDGKTILAPQPSDSPNDPLNWSTMKKDILYLILLVDCICSGVHAAILSPVTVQLEQEFNVDLTQVAQLSSYMLLMIGCVSFVNAPIANVFGKRPVFVIGIIIMMISDAWASKAGSYNSLFGARMLSGVGESSFSTLALAVVPDLYFVHQRSRRILAFIFFSTSGAYLGTVIGGQIIAISNWRNAFMGLAITEAVMVVLTFLFFEETQYKRTQVDPLANLNEEIILEKVSDHPFTIEQVDADSEAAAPASAGSEKPKTFVQKLYLYNGRFSLNNPLILFYRSVILCFHPTILYATCFTILYSWDAGVSFTIDAFMTLPPYNFSTGAVANMFLAPWLGVLVAAIAGEPILNWLALGLAKRNGNIYEPEFRLWGAFPGVILGIIGCIGWGWGEQNTISWVGLAFFNAIMAAGAVLMNATGVGFIIDAHREYANESQVILFSLRCFFAYGMGYYLIPWWESAGPKTMWAIITASFTGTALFGLVFYVFGKRMRLYWSRHHFLWVPELKREGEIA